MRRKWAESITTIGILCLAAVSLCGCGTPDRNTAESRNHDQVQQHDTLAETDTRGSQDSTLHDVQGEYYAGADLQGTVVSFDEIGFLLSPAVLEGTEDGGEVMMQAAPGQEEERENVQILYDDKTEFEEVRISLETLSELSRSSVSRDAVKKQSEVCVFGSCRDTVHWDAEKILILRWQ